MPSACACDLPVSLTSCLGGCYSDFEKNLPLQYTTLKQSIRAELLLRKRALSAAERQQKSRGVLQLLLQLHQFREARVIHLYLSHATEVETDTLFHLARRMNKQVAVPVIELQKKSLRFSELKVLDSDVLEPGPFKIRQPRTDFQKRVDPKSIDLWIMPGVGFDLQGNRLGQGGGYYDHVLQNIDKPRVGLAFEIQIIPHLPVETSDVPVDYVITEKRTIVCRRPAD